MAAPQTPQEACQHLVESTKAFSPKQLVTVPVGVIRLACEVDEPAGTKPESKASAKK